MNTLQLVTRELARFVFIEHFGFTSVETTPRQPSLPLLVAPPQLVKLDKASVENKNPVPVQFEIGEILYVTEQPAHLFYSPVAAFDGVITKIPFGAPVQANRIQNRWQEVVFGNLKGWILKDHLSKDPVNPQFISGTLYDAEDKETKTVRAFIDDDFFGGSLCAPLQDVEYVTFRLATKAKYIEWSHQRPRLAGTWQRLLKGQPGIHVSVSPGTDSVMEVIDEDDVGHVLYVDAVFNDNSILVSEVGNPEVGQFYARKLTESEWKELRPVFINVS